VQQHKIAALADDLNVQPQHAHGQPIRSRRLANAHFDMQASRHSHGDERVQPEEANLAAHQVGHPRRSAGQYSYDRLD
jgi:hypothetical protein